MKGYWKCSHFTEPIILGSEIFTNSEAGIQVDRVVAGVATGIFQASRMTALAVRLLCLLGSPA
jgi:hypothetical protein